MAVIFGLAAAISYGVADFIGGLVTKRTSVFAVVFWSQVAGTLLIAIALPLFGGEPTLEAIGWGAASGVAGGVGVLFLYRGLARGRMSVVAPLTAVEAASIPVLYGFVTGERPSAMAIIGVGVALAAVYLVSSSPLPIDPEGEEIPSGITDALAAGLGFGAFFIFLGVAGENSGMWPLVGARAASISTAMIGAVLLHGSLKAQRSSRTGIVAAGCLDVVANIFYILSTRRGLLALAAVLTSLYPAATVVCARIVLNELVHRRQMVGLAFVFAAIALIGFG
jgi:drug/metabolite transporter (DMT)-like permease